jgi:hypothetical protein
MSNEKPSEKKKSNFSCMFLNPNNCSNSLDLKNLQEQVKKSILLPKIVLTFHCLNNFDNKIPLLCFQRMNEFAQLKTRFDIIPT